MQCITFLGAHWFLKVFLLSKQRQTKASQSAIKLCCHHLSYQLHPENAAVVDQRERMREKLVERSCLSWVRPSQHVLLIHSHSYTRRAVIVGLHYSTDSGYYLYYHCIHGMYYFPGNDMILMYVSLVYSGSKD